MSPSFSLKFTNASQLPHTVKLHSQMVQTEYMFNTNTAPATETRQHKATANKNKKNCAPNIWETKNKQLIWPKKDTTLSWGQNGKLEIRSCTHFSQIKWSSVLTKRLLYYTVYHTNTSTDTGFHTNKPPSRTNSIITCAESWIIGFLLNLLKQPLQTGFNTILHFALKQLYSVTSCSII